MKILVVGGSSVSGQCAINAIKELNQNNTVISTSSRDAEVKGADITIGEVALEEASATDKILNHEAVKDIDYVIYIPARGMVGISARDATLAQVEESLDYCFRPFLRMVKTLQPKKGIALSGFITMQPLLEVYGAMTFTKIAMEQIAVKYPEKVQLLRIGMFHSSSVRGIALLVQRRLMKDKSFRPELFDNWKSSGKKFSEFFYEKNYRFEEDSYKQHAAGKPFRPTEPDDIKEAFKLALQGEKAPIINVLGSWLWKDSEMPYLPPAITDNIELIPDDLEKLLV